MLDKDGSQFRYALDTDEFLCSLQPVVCLRGGERGTCLGAPLEVLRA